MAMLTARDAAALFRPLFIAGAREMVAVLFLDAANRQLALECWPGEAETVALPLRAILRIALDLDAVGLIVAHDHPSGDPQPSRADILATRLLAETAGAVGIRLHDHLIFAGTRCRSLRALGLL